MSAGLEFTIRDHLRRGKDPEELIEEIKTSWSQVNERPSELERARQIINDVSGSSLEKKPSKFQQALNGDK